MRVRPIRSWKRSLQIRPDAQVQKYLEKAERDANGVLTYRSVYTTTVNLKNEKLLTIGATKSETSSSCALRTGAIRTGSR